MAIIISKRGSRTAEVVNKTDFALERDLQDYICSHPEAIPVEDRSLLVVTRELQTESGPIDAFAVDRNGDLYIVETKLYRNPDKRTVVAQALDYGASLSWHSNFEELLSHFNDAVAREWKMSFRDKLAEFFSLDDDGVELLVKSMRRNLSEGNLKFVVLMDELEDRLKDLIAYVNRNSKFNIYAVQIEFYKHDEYEIVIPKLYGSEVKKDLGTEPGPPVWDWIRFEKRLREHGKEEVEAARQIMQWAENNGARIEWTNSQRGSFILCYPQRFFPFAITGDALVSWNAPHQGKRSPKPFDNPDSRTEILRRLQGIKGATVDLNNVDGYSGLKLPLRCVANNEARATFFSVCSWIRDSLETQE